MPEPLSSAELEELEKHAHEHVRHSYPLGSPSDFEASQKEDPTLTDFVKPTAASNAFWVVSPFVFPSHWLLFVFSAQMH